MSIRKLFLQRYTKITTFATLSFVFFHVFTIIHNFYAMHNIEIFEATPPLTKYLTDINSLIGQLSDTANHITADDLERLTASAASHLFLADADSKAVGMCTLAVYDAPTGRKAWIEDVAVDSRFRGLHIGRRLVERATEEARKYAPCTLMLTSRPTRVAANALYQSAGFEKKETNVYKMKL